jgi:glycosyltransferase involved in cell wall biosynthesis
METCLTLVLDATVFEHQATGVAKTTAWLYDACLREAPSLRVIAAHHHELVWPSADIPPGLRLARHGRRLPSRVWRMAVLPAHVAARSADVVHFPWNGQVPRLLPGPLVVTTLHDVLPLEIPGYFSDEKAESRYRRSMQRDLSRTDLLLTVSDWSKNQILKNFRVAREPLVLHHGPTLDVHTLGPNARADAPAFAGAYVLYVGGYHPRKGLVQLLRTFLTLRRQNQISGSLLLTGSPHHFSEEFKKLIEEGRSTGWVQETGYVSDAVLASLYRGAKALIYPSKYEGFGLPPLEAMALGCPVLTTRGTAIPEVCGDAVCYAEPDDVEQFARAIVALDRDPELRRDLAARGKARAAVFSWARSANKYLQALMPSTAARGPQRGGPRNPSGADT